MRALRAMETKPSSTIATHRCRDHVDDDVAAVDDVPPYEHTACLTRLWTALHELVEGSEHLAANLDSPAATAAKETAGFRMTHR
jgi:hypothetical protein